MASTSKVMIEAIDFDNAFPQDTEITFEAVATPRYVSPEIAKLLLQRMGGKTPKTTKAEKGIDIFALGLIIWELANENHSLWEALSVSHDDKNAILVCAADLTDKIIQDAIKMTFKGDIRRSLRSWLEDALKVNPAQRWSAERLLNEHSLFGKQAGTLNIADTVARMETKIDVMDHKLDSLTKLIYKLSIFVKLCNGKLDFPTNFIVIPLEDTKSEKSGFSIQGIKSFVSKAWQCLLQNLFPLLSEG